ncbi:MAG: energy transducer TonB [Chitinophagaceae bacterium]|nr:energy transducer TonB [Chitinophagaceae bacterium]
MAHRLIASFCFLCCMLSGLSIKAQGFVIDSMRYGPDTVYISPDVSASFPGGKERMYEYIEIKFDAYADGIGVGGAKEGTMEVNFVVEANGRIKHVFIGNSISVAYDEEMVRALISMPKWEPAVVNNRKVRSLQTLRYKLNFYQR